MKINLIGVRITNSIFKKKKKTPIVYDIWVLEFGCVFESFGFYSGNYTDQLTALICTTLMAESHE